MRSRNVFGNTRTPQQTAIFLFHSISPLQWKPLKLISSFQLQRRKKLTYKRIMDTINKWMGRAPPANNGEDANDVESGANGSGNPPAPPPTPNTSNYGAGSLSRRAPHRTGRERPILPRRTARSAVRNGKPIPIKSRRGESASESDEDNVAGNRKRVRSNRSDRSNRSWEEENAAQPPAGAGAGLAAHLRPTPPKPAKKSAKIDNDGDDDMDSYESDEETMDDDGDNNAEAGTNGAANNGPNGVLGPNGAGDGSIGANADPNKAIVESNGAANAGSTGVIGPNGPNGAANNGLNGAGDGLNIANGANNAHELGGWRAASNDAPQDQDDQGGQQATRPAESGAGGERVANSGAPGNLPRDGTERGEPSKHSKNNYKNAKNTTKNTSNSNSVNSVNGNGNVQPPQRQVNGEGPSGAAAAAPIAADQQGQQRDGQAVAVVPVGLPQVPDEQTLYQAHGTLEARQVVREDIGRALFLGEPDNGQTEHLDRLRGETGRPEKFHHNVVNTLMATASFTPHWRRYRTEGLDHSFIFGRACEVLRGIAAAQKNKQKQAKKQQKKRQVAKRAAARGAPGTSANAGGNVPQPQPQPQAGGGAAGPSHQPAPGPSAPTAAATKRPAPTSATQAKKPKKVLSDNYMKVLEVIQTGDPSNPIEKLRMYSRATGQAVMDAFTLDCAIDMPNWEASKPCEQDFSTVSETSREGHVFLIPMYEDDVEYFKGLIDNKRHANGRVFRALTHDQTCRIEARTTRTRLAELVGVDRCVDLVKSTKANGVFDLDSDSFKMLGGGIEGEGANRYVYIRAQVDKVGWTRLRDTARCYLHIVTERWRIWSGGHPMSLDSEFPPIAKQKKKVADQQKRAQAQNGAAAMDTTAPRPSTSGGAAANATAPANNQSTSTGGAGHYQPNTPGAPVGVSGDQLL